MNNTAKLKILILEDNLTEIQNVHAGLIPNIDHCSKIPSVISRQQLAHQIYEFKEVVTIKDFFKFKDEFDPDIYILDIDLGNSPAFKIGSHVLKNGLDVYEYLKKEDRDPLALLNTGSCSKSEVFQRIKNHFEDLVLKNEVAGNLSHAIPAVLEKATKKIIDSAPQPDKTAIVQKLLSKSIQKQAIEQVKLGGRYIQIIHLILHEVLPEFQETNSGKHLHFIFPEQAASKIISRLEEKNTIGSAKINAAFKRNKQVEQAISDYAGELQKKAEHREIKNKVDEIIQIIISPIPMERVVSKLSKTKLKDHRLIDGRNKNARIAKNEVFKYKFYNFLAVRRVIFVVELFMQQHIDQGRKIKSEYKNLFVNFYSCFFGGLQNKTSISPGSIAQKSRELGIAFDVKTGYQRCERALFKYKIYDFEQDWIRGKHCSELISQMAAAILT